MAKIKIAVCSRCGKGMTKNGRGTKATCTNPRCKEFKKAKRI